MFNTKIDISKGWMPDLLPEYIAKAGGLAEAKNILPINGIYSPVQDKVTYNDNAASGIPLKGIYIQASDGDNYNFLGTTTKLYKFDKTNMSDMTRASGGDYSGSFWDFAVYGNWLIATNYADDPQIKKIVSDSTKFVVLGGTPPKARYCLIVNGHLIFAYTFYSATAYPKQLIWSGLELPETINTADLTDLTTGAGYQDIPELDGVITGLAMIGKGFGIFAENSIALGMYVGGEGTFNFDRNAIKNVGCYYPGSLISIGEVAFFWSKNSIYGLSTEGLKEIGQNIKRTIFDNLNTAQSNKIVAHHVPESNLIIWTYVTSTASNPDKMLVYNYSENRFTILDITSLTAMYGNAGPYDVINNTNILIDNMSGTINSYANIKNLKTLIIDTDNKVKTLIGSYLQAEFQTGEVGDNDLLFMARRIYPAIEQLTGAGNVTVKSRYSTTDIPVSSSSSTIKSDGYADLRTTNRKIAFNIKATNFQKIGNIIEADLIQSGGR